MKAFFKSLWNSETAFIRVIRASLFGLGAYATAQSGGVDVNDTVAVIGAVSAALGGLLGAGEMNPTEPSK